MKGKIIVFLVMTLFFTTALQAVGTTTEMDENQIINNHDSMFIQLPEEPFTGGYDWYAWGSTTYPDWFQYTMYEDFWDVTSPICDIYCWGLILNLDEEDNADPTGILFNITFYEDDGTGKPGNELYTYEDVSPSFIDTGFWYNEEVFMLDCTCWYFKFELNPCYSISDGWISIVSTSCPSDGTFFWSASRDGNGKAYRDIDDIEMDLSLVLTDGEIAESDLECEGSLNWVDVKPNSMVMGEFTVKNEGEAGSILHWMVEEYPNWGEWTFNPEGGYLSTEPGSNTVEVIIEAPSKKDENFTGIVKLINPLNLSDYCEIDVSLTTPRSKLPTNTFLLRLLERFPNLFPIIRQILGQ